MQREKVSIALRRHLLQAPARTHSTETPQRVDEGHTSYASHRHAVASGGTACNHRSLVLGHARVTWHLRRLKAKGGGAKFARSAANWPRRARFEAQ